MKSKQARGGFFAALKTEPYQPQGLLLGQETDDSCAAACCRMLLFDQLSGNRNDYHYAECFIREVLGTDKQGSNIRRIPDAPDAFGAPMKYVLRRKMTAMELLDSSSRHFVIALLPIQNTLYYHALIVDEIESQMVAVRDPLPVGQGTAYRLSLSAFLASWLNDLNQCGLAVTVLE
jgi:hypothetical protein